LPGACELLLRNPQRAVALAASAIRICTFGSGGKRTTGDGTSTNLEEPGGGVLQVTGTCAELGGEVAPLAGQARMQIGHGGARIPSQLRLGGGCHSG